MAAPHFGLQLTKHLRRSIPNNFPLPPTSRFLLPIALKKRFLLLVDGQAASCSAAARSPAGSCSAGFHPAAQHYFSVSRRCKVQKCPGEQRRGLWSLPSQESPSPRTWGRQEIGKEGTQRRLLFPRGRYYSLTCYAKNERLSPHFWSRSLFLPFCSCNSYIPDYSKEEKSCTGLKTVVFLAKHLNYWNLTEKLAATTTVSSTSIGLDQTFNALLPVNFRATKISCLFSNYLSLLLHFFCHPLCSPQHSHCMLLTNLSNTCCSFLR